MFSMNLIGRWADRSGKRRVFGFMSTASVVPILLLTNLPPVSLVIAVGASTLLMVCMTGRFVPAMSLTTASIESKYRGGFMSVNSSVQQLAAGLAAWVSGMILRQRPTGEIAHFSVIGLVSVFCALFCIYLSRFLISSAENGEPRNPVILGDLEQS